MAFKKGQTLPSELKSFLNDSDFLKEYIKKKSPLNAKTGKIYLLTLDDSGHKFIYKIEPR